MIKERRTTFGLTICRTRGHVWQSTGDVKGRMFRCARCRKVKTVRVPRDR